MNVGELNVKLKVDLKTFSANMTKAGDQMKSFARTVGSSMTKATKSIARFAASAGRSLAQFASRWLKRATIAIGAFTVASIKMAIDVEESENLVRESFKDMTEAVIDWSENLQKSLGLNASALREQAGYLNLLSKSMGLTADQAYIVSTSLVELTQHVASLRNKKFHEVFEKMRSGLVGMTRPLQDIGINIKENAIEEMLLKEGIDATVASMTEAQKIMARYILILRATNIDQGDLARTYDDTQNVIRVIVSQIKVMMEQMGAKLLPIVNALAISFRDWLIDNREDIVLWYGTVVSKLQAFITFLQVDYRKGFEGTLRIMVKLLEASAEAMYSIWEITWQKMGADIIPLLWKGMEATLGKMKEIAAVAGKNIFELIFTPLFGYILGADDITPVMTEVTKGNIKLTNSLRQSYKKLEDQISAIMNETIKWGEANKQTEEEAEEAARRREQRNKEMAEMAERIKTQLAEQEKAMLDFLRSDVKAVQDANNDIENDTAETVNKWKKMWADASSSIAGSMESAFSDIVENASHATQAISNMLRSISRAISGAVFQQYIGPRIFDLIKPIVPLEWPGARATTTKEGTYQPIPAFQHGGVVPSLGSYKTDSVLARLTPGEEVLTESTSKRVRELLSGQSTPQVNINVHAIDAQNTMQFLSKNKRMIAGMMEGEIKANHGLRKRR